MIIFIALLVCVIASNKIINLSNDLYDILSDKFCSEIPDKVYNLMSNINTWWFTTGLCVGILIIELFIY